MSAADGRRAGLQEPDTVLATEVVEELQALDEDGTLLRGLITTFRDDSASKLTALREALRTGDDASLGRIAHSVCGGARTLGATGAAGVAKQLQDAARSRQLADGGDLLDRLSREIALAVEALERFAGQ